MWEVKLSEEEKRVQNDTVKSNMNLNFRVSRGGYGGDPTLQWRRKKTG